MSLTGSPGGLGVGEGNALVSDVLPVDAALIGRDADAFCLSTLREALDRDAEGGDGGEECRGESFGSENHRCWGHPLSVSAFALRRDKTLGGFCVGEAKCRAENVFESEPTEPHIRYFDSLPTFRERGSRPRGSFWWGAEHPSKNR